MSAGAVSAGDAPVRVLVVDDSALVRQLMTEILSADPGIEVVGTAADPLIAREKIKQLSPDVLTLDVEMPRMDGLTFLQNLMRLRPMPVVMVSTLTAAGARVTLDALAYGAVDFIAKPVVDVAAGLEAYAPVLREKVRSAARARVSYLAADERDTATRPTQPPLLRYVAADRIIALGASTGGTEALRLVLAAMPEDAPPVVIAQHIPASFSGPFAERLDRHSAMHVREASDGDVVLPGHAYVAPGGRQLRIRRSGGRWRCRVTDEGSANGHRPSVDVMFESVAACAGVRASAALLTGMGDDGARGLLMLRQAGAATLAQDAATSVVWGMPGAAVSRGAAEEVVPLGRVAERVLAGTARATAVANSDAGR